MCDTLIKGFQNVTAGLWQGIQATNHALTDKCVVAATCAGKGIKAGYTWVGRNVENLANKYLPPTAAKIVASTVWSLPYTALDMVLPARAHDAVVSLAIGLWNNIGYDIDTFMGKTTREHAATGLRNASIIRIGIDSAKLVATGNWFLLLPIIANVFFAIQSHVISKSETPPKPQPADQEAPAAV